MKYILLFLLLVSSQLYGAILENISEIASGHFHTCALTNAGGVKCWGPNNAGQLGDGTTTNSETPVNVSGLSSGVTALAAGNGHTCALTDSGGVKCWGRNNYGQLGDGTTTQRHTPVDVTGLTSGVTAIMATSVYNCAITNSGGMKCWGLNSVGQLGDGTTNDSNIPVDVSGLNSDVKAITGGGGQTCALLNSGGVKCWGNNAYGQVGDGTTNNSNIPIDVSGLNSGVTAISAGYEHTCALTDSDEVKCWGKNEYGQVGDGTTNDSNIPVDVSGLSSGVTAITAMGHHTCVLTSSGGVKCWGYNVSGQLGDGTTTDKHTQMDVSGLSSGVTAITTGFSYTCAITNSGNVKCWGDNDNGQLGDGTTTDRLTPVDVLNSPPVAGFGNALNFDATDDYVQMNDFALDTSDFTIEAWVKRTISGGYLITNRTSESGGDGNWFAINAGANLALHMGKAGVASDVFAKGGNTSLSAHKWYHLAVVRDSSTITFYINAIQDGQFTDSPIRDLSVASNISRLDGWKEQNAVWFGGQIDEVRIWNTARTQNQIQTNMYTTLQGNESGLVAYYDFENGTGTTLTDKSTNNNDGTLNGPTWVDSNVTFTTNEDTPFSDILPAYDADNDTLTYTKLSDNDPNKGTISIFNTSNGLFLYTPNPDFNGTDSFTYKVNDGTSDSNTATVTINITAVNDPPSFTSSTITSINEDTTYTYNITATDVDTGDTLTITAPTLPNWLNFTDNGNGTATLTGTPNNSNTGNHNVSLQVSDTNLNDTQNFTITVNAINDAPVADDKSFTIPENTDLSNNLTASDVEGNTLIYSIVSQGSKGTATIDNANTGAFTYSPTSDVNGTDTFTYKVYDGSLNSNIATVTINITPETDPPVFDSTAVTSATEDLSYTYNIVTSDVDGDTLTITAPTKPNWLTLNLNPTGNGTATATLTGIPRNSEVGNHSITLAVDDSTNPAVLQTFTINVSGVNDAPVAGFGKALDFDGTDDYVLTDSITTGSQVTIEAWVKSSYSGAPQKQIYNGSGPPHLILDQVNNKWTAKMYSGSGVFVGNITGPDVSLNIWTHLASVYDSTTNQAELFVNGVSVGTATAPSDAAHTSQRNIGRQGEGANYFQGQIDEVRIWNTARTETDIQADMYKTLKGNESGLVAYYPFEDGIGITATDHKNSQNGTLNKMDNADWVDSDLAITYAIAESQTINSRLPAIDIDSSTLTYTIVNPPTKGTIPGFPNTTGNLTYTPNAGENGIDSFAYQVSDGSLTSNTVVVNITLTGVNEQPSFTANNPPTVNEDAGTEIVTGWITSFNQGTGESAQTVSYIVENVVDTNNLFATVPAVSSIGNLTYTLNPDVSGTASFNVKIQDNGGTANGGVDTSAPQTFTLTVNSVNDQPNFTANDPPGINENAGSQTLTDWITNFNPGPTDEAAQTAIAYTVSNISNPNLFAVEPAISAAGDLTYTPATNASGTSFFQVTVTDSGGTTNGGLDTSAAKTFTITIAALANMPGVTPANTQEDTMTTDGLVISRHPDDGPEVTHFKITNIQAGTLYHNNGLTIINDGDFITFAQANVGLRFLPAPNSFAQGSFDIQAAQGNMDSELSGDIQTATITVSAVADTPSVTNVYTEENVQSSDGLVISRNEVDGTEVTHFKITNIQLGSLYQNDGITPITSNDFMTVEQGNAGLKFTPLTIYNGTFEIQASISADDNGLGGDVITATINVGLTNDPPKLTLACAPQTEYCTLKCQKEKQPPEGEEPKMLCTMTKLFGGLVNFVASATDPDVPQQNLRFSLTNAPTGALINPLTGEFAWQPTAPGEFTFTIVVTDDGTNPNDLTDEHEMTLTLTKDPILMPIGDLNVPIDNLFTFTAQAKHHNPFTFSLEQGSAEATLDPQTGQFKWTPAEEGNFTATIRVTESGGLFAEETFIINVERNLPPELEPIERMSVLPLKEVKFTAQATDPNKNKFIYRLLNAPSGATIHLSNGEFTWIPTQTGKFTIFVEAVETDGRPENLTASQMVDIFVNDKPIILPMPAQNTPINLPLLFTIKAIHAEDHTMIYTLLSAPAGATIELETGEFAWTPDTEGDYEIIVQVTETVDNLSSEATIPIAVSDNTPPELTAIESQVVPLNRLFRLQVEATDAQENQLLYQLDEAPEGTVLHPLNGELTWIPNEIGTYPFKLSVTEIDGMPINLTSSTEFELTVNTQPAIDKIDNQSINMGNTLTYPVTAFHPLGNRLGFELINPPAGASIHPDSGLFIWTPNRANIYDIQIQVFDKINPEFKDTEIITLTANKVLTRLVLQLSSNTILKNGVLHITGTLFREVKTSITLEELPIELTILGPNQTWRLHTQTQADGSFQFQELPTFEQEGDYLFQANFEGNNAFAEFQSEQQPLVVRNMAGYAILVQGRTADDEDGLIGYNKTMNRIYQRMKQRGFKDQDIEYFNFNTNQSKIGIEVDAEPSLSVIQAAFNKMQQRLNAAPAPLFIVMVDHGGIDGSFYIDNGNGASIKTSDVSRWLSRLENGLNPEALAQPRIIVIGSCYAGTFLSPLSKPGRIIIVSADADEESFKGPKEPDETRSGEFFTEAFFAQLARGKSLKTAFELATETTETLTRQGNNARIDNRFQDSAAQHPLLDDDGDKIGSNTLSTGLGDGVQAETIYLGSGINFDTETTNLGGPAEILLVTNTLNLEATNSVGELFAVVNNANRVQNHQVIVDIRPPSVSIESQGAEAKSAAEINNLIRMFLPASNEPNRFSSHLDVFQEPGQYEVMYFVVDAETSEMSPFQRSVVYKNRLGNRPPKAFHLQVPEDNGESETSLIFNWDSTFDPDLDPFTYTLMIATDPEFHKVVYRQKELTLSMSYLNNNTPIDDPLKDSGLGLRDGTKYYWQVEAIDPYGARAISEVFSFTTNNTNAPPGIGSFQVSSALDFSAIDDAEFLLLDEFGNPLPLEDIYQDQGFYNMLLPPGRRRAAVIRATGYQEKEIKLEPSSEVTIINIKLEQVGEIPVKPGQLQFALEKTKVAENQETISLLVKRIDGRDGQVSINYSSDNGTAIDGRDYLGTQGTLTWADQDKLPKRITVVLKNDTEPERDKTFKMILSEPTGGAALGSIQTISVTITDDDWQELETSNSETNDDWQELETSSENLAGNFAWSSNGGSSNSYTGSNQLRFLSPNYIISEGGNNTKAFPVIRLGSTNQSVSVQYRINGGSATQGQDYTGGNGSLTWPAGNDLPKYLNLTILEDEKPEENETIELSLFNPIGEIRLGEFNQATLTIRDNDGPLLPPTVQFSSENETAYEGDQEPITLTVTRTGTSSEGEVSVQYFVMADGTADTHVDYTGELFGKLTWAEGDSEPKFITFQIMDDKELENPETVHIKLFNASGEISLGTPTETTVTIIDNEHLLPTIPLSLGPGMGVANEGTLYRAIDLKNLFETSVIFWGGAKIKGQDFSTTLFPQPSQMVEIVGEIHVDPKHVGKQADILVVASASDEVSEVAPLFLMLDNRGQVQLWDGDLTTLVGIEENFVLPKTQVIEIFRGFLAPVHLQIYFGYRLQEDGFIYFNGEQPLKVWVEPEHEYSLDDDNSILFADWSQDGQLLVTASTDSIVRLWDMNTGSRLAELRGHTDTVKTAIFSPDGKQILTASTDHTARLWKEATHQEFLVFQGHTDEVTYATFSPNGRNIITASADKTARIWDAKTGDTLFILEGHEQGIQYATFSHDAKQIATASWDHTARLWDATTGEELAVLTGHDNMVEHVAFSPNDQYLVTTSWDKTAKLWDTHTGQEIFTLTGHRNGIAYATFSPNGEYLLTTSWDNSVRLWFVKTGEPVWVREHQAGVHHAAFSPNGHKIVTGSNDGTARLWETATGKPLKTLKGHQGNVWQVGFSPDGKQVISASWDNSVRVWEVDSGEVIMILKD